MSLAELKEQVAVLSAKERAQLAAFLTELEEIEYQAEMSRRMKVMDTGKKVTAEDFEKRHADLKARGQ